MPQRHFPLFTTQVQLAHSYWESLLSPGDCVLDLTCGNGHDTLFLANIVLKNQKGKIIAYDIQDQAIQQSKSRLKEILDAKSMQQISFYQKCHSLLPKKEELPEVKLIVYNLGYLPGADKSQTTKTRSTLESLDKATQLISPAGAISIMCYPGHPEGKLEESAIIEWAQKLNVQEWHCCHHQQINGNKAPSLMLIQKAT
ncbi:Putative rRNA methylase YtqB [Chlamydiales bacterium SCGC AG-110-M15]|nr:Putative rRNA methylase YtqB [Chlamydiales bacterium SCGC AG-110-M15]